MKNNMNRIEQLKEFLKENPNDCFLNHALALEHIKAGDDEQAQLLFEKNKSFDPAYVGTYFHLAQLLERKDEDEKALAIYQEGMVQAQAQKDQHSLRELRNAHDLLEFE